MVSALASWLVILAHDSQRARNVVLPEHSDSPIVLLTLLAFSAALESFLRYPQAPFRQLLPVLVTLSIDLAPLTSEAMSAMVEAPLDTVVGEGHDRPGHADIQRETEQLREDLHRSKAEIVRWRLDLAPLHGVQLDRRLHAMIHCIEEIQYFDPWPPLEMIVYWLRNLQIEIQQAIVERATMVSSGRGVPDGERDDLLMSP